MRDTIEIRYWNDGGGAVPYVLHADHLAAIAAKDAKIERLKKQTPISEIVTRLEGAYIVAGLALPVPPDWQVMIDRFLAAAQAQAHLARLASERYDHILELERQVIEQSGENAMLKAQLVEAPRRVVGGVVGGATGGSPRFRGNRCD